MSVNQTKVVEARDLAEDIETMCKALESLVNGKEGFLKDLRKTTKDVGVQCFNEDVFMLKNLATHVLEIMNHIEQMNNNSGAEDDIEEAERKYSSKKHNKSGNVYCY